MDPFRFGATVRQREWYTRIEKMVELLCQWRVHICGVGCRVWGLGLLGFMGQGSFITGFSPYISIISRVICPAISSY